MPLRMTGLISGLDTDAVVKELMSAQSMKKTKIEQKKTKEEWKQDKWKELNTKLYSLYTKQASKLKLQSSYMTKKVTSSNESAVTATATSSAATGSHTLQVNRLATSQYVTGANVEEKLGKEVTFSTELATMGVSGTIDINGTEYTVGSEGFVTVSDFVTKLQEAGLNATFDEGQGRFFISSKESGADKAFTLAGDSLGNLGLTSMKKEGGVLKAEAEVTKTVTNQDGTTTETTAVEWVDIAAQDNGTIVSANGVSIVAAVDAEIVLDGATLTNSSNNFSVAGLTLDLKDTTDGKISLNTTNDVDAVYDSIKDFFKEYNSILEEMNKLYNADSAKGYEPLTDEEKEAMSEEQIEMWEEKIKDSLLRRDSTLGNLMNAMKSAMQSAVEVDGEKYSLSSFGIMTSSDWTEGGLLHIHGNEDDAAYSTYTDKLKSALASNPEVVTQTLSSIIKNLSDTMADKMKKTSLSSALTFYNDVQIKNNISDYEDEIDKWEDRLEEMENRYYDQFTAMEKAMATLQSQSSYLMNLMGTSA